MKKYLLIILIMLFQIPGYPADIQHPADTQHPADIKRPGDKNGGSGWEELYFRANQLYKDGKYEDALNAYLEVAAVHKSGNLYYNMGNAGYRLNMTGRAILYYERAKLFMPRDSDLDFNLRFVRKLTKDAVDPPSDAVSGLLFWIKSMTLCEVFGLFAFMNLFFFAALCIRIFVKKEWTYYLPVVLLVVWIITGASFAWKYYTVSADKRAVVLSEEIEALSGPDPGDTLLFKLHSGTVVINERTEDEWKLIRLPDNKRGWVKAGDVENIRENNGI